MADRVFFVAGSPEDFFPGVIPPEMIDTLMRISTLPTPQIEQVGNSLQEADGLLDDQRFEEAVREVVADPDAADAIVDTIRNIRPTAIEDTLERLGKWRDANNANAVRLSEASLAAIRAALLLLVRDYPALERYRKARRLATFTGKQARNIDFVCDARPVFDPDRHEIEGFATQTILRIVHESQTHEIGSIEIVISPSQLRQIIDKAERARQKLDSMSVLVERWLPGRFAGPVE